MNQQYVSLPEGFSCSVLYADLFQRPGSPGGPDASTFLTQLNRKDQTVTTDSTEAHPPRHYTPTQKSLLARKAEMAKSPQGYMESVVENFRRANLGQVVEGRGAKSVGVAIIGGKFHAETDKWI